MRQNLILVFCLNLCLFSCKKDKPDNGSTNLPKDSTSKILIVCEGSLGNGNAELSVYLPLKDSVFNSVYKNANAQELGDVFQSVSKINDQYFLCINNSDKIVVLHKTNWLQTASISVPKPRYMVEVSANRAYVGSLFSNKIYVLNTKTYSIEKQIEMPYQNVEGMLLKDGFVYACCWDTACTKLYQIDISNDHIVDSIKLAGAAPQSVLLDKDNTLWVLGGNAYKNKFAYFNKIDLISKKVSGSFIFDPGVEAIKPCLNTTKDSVYFLEVDYNGGTANNGVYRMSVTASSLPNAAFISCKANQYFWALNVDPYSGNIYVGDPKGFIQKGTVLVYNPQGILKKQFNAGIGVGSFYFD